MIQRRKAFNPEIIESALRIAMANREEMRTYGFIRRAKKFSQNILNQKEGKLKKDNFLENLKITEKVTNKKALWNKARFLALVRSKRGTRNWSKAKRRVTSRTENQTKSFWRQATEIVFPVSKDQKLLKVL